MTVRNKVVEVVGPPDRKTCAWEGRLSADADSSERFLEFQLWLELYVTGTLVTIGSTLFGRMLRKGGLPAAQA
jgi:hypothetical protein